MLVKKLGVLVTGLLFSFQISHADTTTIVLQNGLAGYSGCEDSHNYNQAPDSNISSSELLQLWNCIA